MKHYDADMIIHYIAMAKEIAESILCLALIIGGLLGMWFIGCALA